MRWLCLAALLALPGCFSPDQPVCAFSCADSVGNGGHCPDNYSCRSDGYCHLNGSTGSCPWDFATPTVDLAVPADAAGAPDLTSHD